MHAWDVCCILSLHTYSAELCAPKEFYLKLYFIGISVKPGSGADISLPSGGVFEIFLFDNAWISNAMNLTNGYIAIHALCMSTNNDMSRTIYATCSFKDARCGSPAGRLNSDFNQRHLDQNPVQTHSKLKTKNTH